MPITNEVSLNEVISSACISFGIEENDKYKVVFYEWAYQALTEIGLSDVNIKTSTGSISTGNTAVIPSDCVHIDAIAIRVGASGEVAYPIFDSNYWKDVSDDDQMHYDRDYVVSRQGNNLVFSNTVSQNGFNVVLLRYYAIPIASDTSPIIPEYYMRPIMSYIEYMYVKAQRHKDRNSVPLSEMQLFYQQWLSLKSDAISRRNTASKPEIEAAVASWITMLPNQSKLLRSSNKQRRDWASGGLWDSGSGSGSGFPVGPNPF